MKLDSIDRSILFGAYIIIAIGVIVIVLFYRILLSPLPETKNATDSSQPSPAQVIIIGDTIKIKTGQGEIKNGVFAISVSKTAYIIKHKQFGANNFKVIKFNDTQMVDKIRDFLNKYGTYICDADISATREQFHVLQH